MFSVIDCKGESEVALSSCVSSYGLIVDAYAVGATLSEVLTGVPPGEGDATRYVRKYHYWRRLSCRRERTEVLL